MRKIFLPIVSLLLCAAILLIGNNVFSGIRAARIDAELLEKMQELLPGSTTFTEEPYAGDDSNISFVYRAETGFVIGTHSYGYAGYIDMLVGVSSDGAVTGLQIRQMEETHGLGAKALNDADFLSQFLYTTGNAVLSSASESVDFQSAATESQDVTISQGEGTPVDALTGATVTTKAIVRSVNSAVAYVTGADVSSAATSWGG